MKFLNFTFPAALILMIVGCAHNDNTGSHSTAKADLKTLNDHKLQQDVSSSLIKIDGEIFSKIEAPLALHLESMSVKIESQPSGKYRYNLQIQPANEPLRIQSGLVVPNGDSNRMFAFEFDSDFEVSDITFPEEKRPGCLMMTLTNPNSLIAKDIEFPFAPIIICK